MTRKEYKKWLIKKLQQMRKDKHAEFSTCEDDDIKIAKIVGSLNIYDSLINFIKYS